MIQYLKHNGIDKNRWDDCIAHAVNGNGYAWSWYLDVASPGWEALVEITDDSYLSVMPLTCKRKYFINYLCQPFFVQQLGVFSTQALTSETVVSFLKAIPQKYRLIEIRLNEGNRLPDAMQGVTYHRNQLLHLNDSYDVLLSNYHENTMRNLKKSLNHGLQVVKGVPMEAVIALFRSDRGRLVTHWGEMEYGRLLRIADAALTSSNAFVYGIQHPRSQKIICGAFFLYSHDRITFLFSGNSILGRETQAMTFLIDAVVREFAGRSLVLDFEGSDNENLSRYYAGFGSATVRYPDYRVPLFNKR